MNPRRRRGVRASLGEQGAQRGHVVMFQLRRHTGRHGIVKRCQSHGAELTFPYLRYGKVRHLAAGRFATRSIGVLPGDLPEYGIHPSRGRLSVGQHPRPEIRRQPFANLRNDFLGDVLLAQRLQCLNDESAFRKSEASLFQSSVIKNKSSASDMIRPIRTVRQVDCPCGHLRGKTE